MNSAQWNYSTNFLLLYKSSTKESFWFMLPKLTSEPFANLSIFIYSSLKKNSLLFPSQVPPFLDGIPCSEEVWFIDYPGTSSNGSIKRESWILNPVVKDHFWEMVDKLSLSVSIPFNSTDEEETSPVFQLVRWSTGEGRILTSTCSVLGMRIEKGTIMVWLEVWVELSNKLAVQHLMLEVMGLQGETKRMYPAGVKKGMLCSSLDSLTRHSQDLELLVSRWSYESHTF